MTGFSFRQRFSRPPTRTSTGVTTGVNTGPSPAVTSQLPTPTASLNPTPAPTNTPPKTTGVDVSPSVPQKPVPSIPPSILNNSGATTQPVNQVQYSGGDPNINNQQRDEFFNNLQKFQQLRGSSDVAAPASQPYWNKLGPTSEWAKYGTRSGIPTSQSVEPQMTTGLYDPEHKYNPTGQVFPTSRTDMNMGSTQPINTGPSNTDFFTKIANQNESQPGYGYEPGSGGREGFLARGGTPYFNPNPPTEMSGPFQISSGPNRTNNPNNMSGPFSITSGPNRIDSNGPIPITQGGPVNVGPTDPNKLYPITRNY